MILCFFHFNPRSREGSDKISYHHAIQRINISIHAPARGATPASDGTTKPNIISIHAPARGATLYSCKRFLAIVDFNPRSREGSDDYDTVNFWQARDFNPRSREGSDAIFVEVCYLFTYFNPRSREGSDRKYTQTTNIISVYFYLYYIIFVSLATNTAYITITKPSKCRCESPYTFC